MASRSTWLVAGLVAIAAVLAFLAFGHSSNEPTLSDYVRVMERQRDAGK
jgi:hypothetical protein